VTYSIRHGRLADRDALGPWTESTFAWGDYVVESMEEWLAHPQSRVLVATDEADVAIAVARGVMLSPDEMWSQGVRVHPDWRRMGIASDLGRRLCAWGATAGAKVALLMTEDWNEAARHQVSEIGYRQTAVWLRAFKPTVHSGRGEVTAPAEPMSRAAAAEVGPAYLAWSGSELCRAARSMMSVTWQWRRLHPDDLAQAAAHGALFVGPTGWAIAAARENYLEVAWIQTTEDMAAGHLQALLGIATEEKATAVEIMMPELLWLAAAASSGEFELERLVLYEKTL